MGNKEFFEMSERKAMRLAKNRIQKMRLEILARNFSNYENTPAFHKSIANVETLMAFRERNEKDFELFFTYTMVVSAMYDLEKYQELGDIEEFSKRLRDPKKGVCRTEEMEKE